MLSFFKKINPLMLLFLPVMAGVSQFIHFDINEQIEISEQTNFLFKQFDFTFSGKNFIITGRILAAVLLSLLTFLFISVLNKNKFFNNNFFHGFIFLFLVEKNIYVYKFIPVLISGIFFLLSLDAIFRLEKKSSGVFDFFNAGFFMSAGSIFYPNLVFFFAIIFISLFSLRFFVLRELLASIIGILTPYYIVFTILFVVKGNIDFIYDFTNNFQFKILTNIKLTVLIFYSYILFIAFLSLFKIRITFQYLKINIRKYINLFFITFLISCFVFIFSQNANSEILIFLSLSASIYVTIFFNRIKNKIFTEILFYILIFLSAFRNFDFLI